MTIPPCPYARFRPQSQPSPGIPLAARSVGHHTVKAGWQDTPFEIEHVVFLWGIQGEGRVGYGNDFTVLPANHIAVLLPGMIQSIEAGDEDWEYCWWTMDGPAAVELTRGFGFAAGVRQVGPAPLDQIFRLDQEIRKAGRIGEIGAGACVYRLLTTAAQATQSLGAERVNPLSTKVEELIEKHWAEAGYGVDAIAAEIGIHRSTLSRRFSAATGSTLIAHLNAVRLQHAMGMLGDAGITVAEVAERCGFKDVTYFCRVFKQQLGVTPSQFRRRR